MIARLGLRFIALAYLALLLIVPVAIIVSHTFSGRPRPGVGRAHRPPTPWQPSC